MKRPDLSLFVCVERFLGNGKRQRKKTACHTEAAGLVFLTFIYHSSFLLLYIGPLRIEAFLLLCNTMRSRSITQIPKSACCALRMGLGPEG